MEIIKYISDYESFIIMFENKIKLKYQLHDNIYEHLDIIKSTDNIESYSYKFYGAGCRVIFNNIVCEYDFSLDENSRYQFSVWKLKIFIESRYKFKMDSSDLKKALENLVNHQSLKKLNVGGKIFDIYLIS